jgi:hypothetical protein
MAKFTVLVTFAAPGVSTPFHVTHRLPGRAASLRMLGSDGFVAVTAVRVSAESPTDAAMAVMKLVDDGWSKSRGQLSLRSWRAHRERVLAGRRGRSDSGWWADDGDGDGTAGVREPRRPLPGPGSLHAELELPGPQL